VLIDHPGRSPSTAVVATVNTSLFSQNAVTCVNVFTGLEMTDVDKQYAVRIFITLHE